MAKAQRGAHGEFVPRPDQRQLVQVMRATGTAMHVIAANLHIDERTLKRHFKEELATGQEQVVAALSASVIRAGLNGDWRAAIAWLARWGPPEWRGHVDHGQDNPYSPLGQAMAAAAGLGAADPVQVYLPGNGRPSALDAAQAAPPEAPIEAPGAPQDEAPEAPGAPPEAPGEDESDAA